MKRISRLILWMGVTAMFLYGCNSDNGVTKETKTVKNEQVVAELTHKQKGKEHIFVYEVKNQTSKDVTFPFNSGKEFDLVVRDAEGNQIYQHSGFLLYTQSLKEKTLKASESLRYESTLKQLEPGTYEVEALLETSNDEQFRTTIKINVQ